MIDYVLQETKEEKLVYIGISMGTTMGFAGFSTQPELEAKVKLFIALAPVATVANIQGALRLMAEILFNGLAVVSWIVHCNMTSHLRVCSPGPIQCNRSGWGISPW